MYIFIKHVIHNCQRQLVFITILFVTGTSLIFTTPSWSAEKVSPKSFKSVDEIIGWIKAKTGCKDLTVCSVNIDLPKKYIKRYKISPGWNLHGKFMLWNFKPVIIIIQIERSRKFQISASDSKGEITVIKESMYEIGRDNKLITSSATVKMGNYRGEEFFHLMVPLLSHQAPSGLGIKVMGEDIKMLSNGFGLAWSPFLKSQ